MPTRCDQPRCNPLADKISAAIGAKISITIRGPAQFTFSTDKVTPDLEDRIRAFFGETIRHDIETTHDDECGSFCYVEAKAEMLNG